MDKKNYIDGVDVSGCGYYQGKKLVNCKQFAIGDFKCEGQICLFKQLRQLKAENDELYDKYEQMQSLYQDEHCDVLNYIQALEEVKQLLTSSMDINLKSADKHFSLIDEAIEKVNEVLK